MIGRLTTPDPANCSRSRQCRTAWWCGSTRTQAARRDVDGTVALLFGRARPPRAAQAQWQGCELARAQDRCGLVADLVAARPLQGEWKGERTMAAGGWRSISRRNKRGNPRPACTKVPKTGWAWALCISPGVKKGVPGLPVPGPQNGVKPVASVLKRESRPACTKVPKAVGARRGSHQAPGCKEGILGLPVPRSPKLGCARVIAGACQVCQFVLLQKAQSPEYGALVFSVI
jgi:hypothetical protein